MPGRLHSCASWVSRRARWLARRRRHTIAPACGRAPPACCRAGPGAAVARGPEEGRLTSMAQEEPAPVAVPDSWRPLIGSVLQGRYRLTAAIAEGAMGSVYRAERVGIERPVAVKFLHASVARDPSFVERFQREARAMARLGHPNCISVIDFG